MTRPERRETLCDYFAFLETCRGHYLVHDDGFRVRTFSYQELCRAARNVARELESARIASGDHVLIWSENRPEWIAAFWGCVLRGAVVVPIDEKHSPDFAQRVATLTAARIVFAGDQVPSLLLQGITVRQLRDLDWTSAHTFTSQAVPPDSPVQILFTSGATADPKGVVITHRNVLANIVPVEREIRKYRIYERPFHPIRFLNLLPLSHMFGQAMALFIPPIIEGTIILQRSQDPREIVKTIRQRRVSVVVCVPKILEVLRNYLRTAEPIVDQQPQPGERALMRWWRYRRVHRRFGMKFWSFVVGGAALDPDLEAFWNRLGFIVIQGYGLTEAAPIVTLNHPFHAGQGTTGKPIGGVEVKIAEDGEVLVRGGNVAAGYFRDRDASSQVFEDGWLHTGDIGELDSEGRLRIKGRKKEMIVLPDGRNVFPEDVESVLNRQPGVRESAVIGKRTESGEQVHAVLTVEEGASTQDVIAKANSALEDHQKVRGFTVWTNGELPRTEGTGKLKRAEIRHRLAGEAVSAPGASGAEIGAHQLDPDTPLETLGLSSLDRVEMLIALETKLGASVDESIFANARTVGDLERLAKSKPPAVERFEAPSWNRKGWAHWHRVVHLNLWILNLARIFAWVRVEGHENLEGIDGPVLFASNHQGYFDTPILFIAMPWKWRHRLAPVMRKEFFDPHFYPESHGRWRWFWSSLGYWLALLSFNSVTIPQREAGARDALRNLGEVIGDGYSPLLFPEGRHSRDESIQPFQPGIGMMASKLNVPVVPIRIRGSNRVLHPDSRFPRPGRVMVKIGKPLKLAGDDYTVLARQIESAVRAL